MSTTKEVLDDLAAWLSAEAIRAVHESKRNPHNEQMYLARAAAMTDARFKVIRMKSEL